ncbi:MAG: HAD hydrolase family protein [Candidatus Omnitrophota bacterium]
MRKNKRQININNVLLIIYDFDGVMTDNRVLLTEEGKEAVWINRGDGLAVEAIKELGIKQLIISSEINPVVGARARKLGIPFIISAKNKKMVLESYLTKKQIPRQKVIFVGNDINDQEAMKFVGWPLAPADANVKIRKIAKIILNKKGGFGVVRELLEILK